MTTFLGAYNTSILAIPAYHVLSFLPHAYAAWVATKGNLVKWDNRNPRSTELHATLKEKLDAETYARYERAEACHANGMENLPLFATTVILGNLAGLKKDGLHGMTGFVSIYLGLRLAYTGVYLSTDTQGPTYIRSGIWIASVVLCFRVIADAAKKLGTAGF
ncbi:hypothetical protein BCR34DRAFT_480590 [Clohesyomyces aquaticus]|uniref:Membrane-associated, eicosanoid/glutathione metabolism protein n=1 Tax=Clohesyomyces aquaticus TaxID=1231657 RepID=A0A1Y1ZTY8_9PLEO|nr:hypothetical protein BCR34DRAFT_480590 [Clohesyomyces aquaticus]